MPPLTILSDSDVNHILHNLTRDDVLKLQESLSDALHWYSTSSDANDCCSDFQPERTILPQSNGSTSIFMPASSTTGQGVKMLNVSSASPDPSNNLPALAEQLSLASQESRSSVASSSPRNSIASTTSLPQSVSTTATSHSSTSHASDKKSVRSSGSSVIRGSLTLQDLRGNTTALINASEITAFRTALASTILLNKRTSVHDVTVFGAGKQAYWHIRLALLLRGPEIHHLNIINRSFDSARNLILRIYNPLPDDPDYENPLGSKYNSKTKISILTPSHTEYSRLLKDNVRASNVIFTTVPSTSPLFPGTYLTNPAGRNKGRYIACIGSYKPHMVELDPGVLKYAVAPHEQHRHWHRRQKEGGAVVVDTVDGALKEAGEIIQARLEPEQVVELGELFMLKREAENRRKQQEDAEARRGREKGLEGGETDDAERKGGCHLAAQSGLREWLSKGNVIYKSVGLGLMDIVVGTELVKLATQMSIGTVVPDF